MSITIATASYDRKLCFWEAGTGRCMKQLGFQDSQVNCMTISPDKVRLAVGGFASIRIFDITPPITTNQNQAPVGSTTENAHTHCVTALLYLQTGGSHLLLSTSEDGHIKIWDPRTATLRLRKDIDTKSPIISAALHPQQTLLFVGSQLGFISIWNMQAVMASALDSNGSSGAGSTGGNGNSPIGNVSASPDANHPVQELMLDDKCAVRSIAVSPHGNLVCAATNAGRVHCIRAAMAPDGSVITLPQNIIDANPSVIQSFAPPPGALTAPVTAKSPTEEEDDVAKETAESASKSEHVDPNNTTTPTRNTSDSNDATPSQPNEQHTSNDVTPTPTALNGTGSGKGTAFSATQSGQQFLVEVFHSFRAHHKYILKCIISPNGKLLATASADYTVALWAIPQLKDAKDDSAAASDKGASATNTPSLDASHNNFSPNQHSTAQFPSVAVTGSPSMNSTFNSTHPSPAKSLGLGEGGAAAGVAAPPPLFPHWKTLTGHHRWVWDCQFSSCSHFLVSVSSDHSGRLWDLQSGKLVVSFNGHSKPVNCVVLDDKPAPK